MAKTSIEYTRICGFKTGDKTVELFRCPLCGSTVDDDSTKLHSYYHMQQGRFETTEEE